MHLTGCCHDVFEQYSKIATDDELRSYSYGPEAIVKLCVDRQTRGRRGHRVEGRFGQTGMLWNNEITITGLTVR